MFPDARVATVIIHYQTPDLLDTTVRSFCRCYSEVPVLIVDNGSGDDSVGLIARLREELDHVSALMLNENRFHGPAMDLALRELESEYVFLLDSDTETHTGGFLEEMLECFASDDVYGVGKIFHVNRRGFVANSGIEVLKSAYMLLKRTRYLKFPPFIHHGLPVLQNFRAATQAGYRLVDYPVDSYVTHFGRGTAARFGYGLGLRGRIDYLLNKLGW